MTLNQSQNVLAERRIIPYSTRRQKNRSTEIHWRHHNYTHKLGRNAKTPHWRLLEYRWFKRFVWFLHRFHPVYSIGRETTRRIYVVREETDKTGGNIQARSSVAPTLEKVGKKCKVRRSTNGLKKRKPENARRLLWSYFNAPEEKEFNETIKNAHKKVETPGLPLCIARPVRTVSMVRSLVNPMRSNRGLRVFWSQWIQKTTNGESFTEPSRTPYCGKRDNSLQRYILVHTFFFCRRLWNLPQRKQRWTRNGKNWKRFQRGPWRKSELRKRWSMKQGRRALQFILHQWTYVIWKILNWRQSTKNTSVEL